MPTCSPQIVPSASSGASERQLHVWIAAGGHQLVLARSTGSGVPVGMRIRIFVRYIVGKLKMHSPVIADAQPQQIEDARLPFVKVARLPRFH